MPRTLAQGSKHHTEGKGDRKALERRLRESAILPPCRDESIGAGGTVTAVGGSQECAVIDTGYGPRVPEIRSAIAWALHQSPRWLIDTHWYFERTAGNSTFAEDQATVVGHANCRARMSQDQFVPLLEWSVRSSPRSAWPVLTFKH